MIGLMIGLGIAVRADEGVPAIPAQCHQIQFSLC